MGDFLTTGNIILIIIGLISIFGFTIIIERLLYLRQNKAQEDLLLEKLRNSMARGYYTEALEICAGSNSPIATLTKVGIENREYSPQTIRDIITDAAALEIPKMEKNISALGSVAQISPLLGLLGTVTGNIQAFDVLGEFGAAAEPALLAPGIAEALLTTAAGIIASIPAIVGYNYLVSRVNHTIIRLENRVSELVLLLKGAHE